MVGGETLDVKLFDYYDYQRYDNGATLHHHHQQQQQQQRQQQQQQQQRQQQDGVGFAVQLCAFVDHSQLVDDDERR